MSKTLKVVKPRSSTALEQLVADYSVNQRGRGLSPRTAALTKAVLEDLFLPWMRKSELTSPDDISQRLLDRWGTYLIETHRTPTGKPLARESVRTYMRTLGSFIRWAQADNAIAEKVKSHQPKAEKRLRETLSRDEISQLENAATTERDRLVIRLLADSGIRLGELLGLRAADLVEQGRERYIKVRGKTGERLVPLPPALFQRLRRYAGRGGERIFLTTRKRAGDFEPVAARSIQNALKFTAAAAGIEKRVHPHGLRHSYVTEALRKKMNVIALQHIMGWASLAMLKDYEHLTPSDSYAAMVDMLRADD